MKRFLLFIIQMYQRTLSLEHGWLGKIFPLRVCRFYPSCSEYMARAIARHGVFFGIFLGMRRLLRCHPWNPGGDDPVPEKAIKKGK